MKVGIAQLKAHLSAHLRAVRQGREVTVMDRDTPVARIVPYERRESLVVRKPLSRRPPGEFPLPPPLALPPGVDLMELLEEERQSHR